MSKDFYKELLVNRKKASPIITAVIHPVDEISLLGAIEAANANIITPVLVGPKHKIDAVATGLNINLSNYELISTPHSHAAAELGIKLANQGKVQAIMKGALHTDELIHAALNKEFGISTDRRMSHVFVMKVSTYSKLLLISDAALNIYPSLEDKKDIVQNVINLAKIIGISMPKVAIVSAVETVSSQIKSTLDAAVLCKMADRGQIKGGVLDGPLAFDNAISYESARIKGIVSSVAGQADIIIVPDLEAGNMLVKQLEYFGNAQSAGVVLGAKIPIILTSRADNLATRLASSALAAIMVDHNAISN